MTNLPGMVVLLFPLVFIFAPIWKKRKNEKPIDTIKKKKEEQKIEQNIIRSVLKVSFCITLLPGSVSFVYYFSLPNKLKIQQNFQTNKQTNSTKWN